MGLGLTAFLTTEYSRSLRGSFMGGLNNEDYSTFGFILRSPTLGNYMKLPKA